MYLYTEKKGAKADQVNEERGGPLRILQLHVAEKLQKAYKRD